MTNRELILDTETTGLFPKDGECIVEVCLLEVLDGELTGKKFHTYLRPKKGSCDHAFKVHQLTDKFLEDKPKFADIAKDLIAFIGDATLVAHFAEFDIGFINAELARINAPALVNKVVCTKKLWKHRYTTGSKLDQICEHYGISTAHRAVHGAEKDCILLFLAYQQIKKEFMTIKYQPAEEEALNDFVCKSEAQLDDTLGYDNLTDQLIARMNLTYKQQVATVPTLAVKMADGTTQYGSERYANFMKVLQKEMIEGADIILALKAFESSPLPTDAELHRSLELDHLTDIADHLTDIIIYCLSEAVKFGIPTQNVLRIIQASNQSKLGADGQPIIDAEGKFLKGPNFETPETYIKALLSAIGTPPIDRA